MSTVTLAQRTENSENPFKVFAVDLTTYSNESFVVDCYWDENKFKSKEFISESDAHSWALDMVVKIS